MITVSGLFRELKSCVQAEHALSEYCTYSNSCTTAVAMLFCTTHRVKLEDIMGQALMSCCSYSNCIGVIHAVQYIIIACIELTAAPYTYSP